MQRNLIFIENQRQRNLKNFMYERVKITQLCLTLYEPMDCTVHRILQTRILELVAFPFSRVSSQTRNQTHVYHIAGGFFTSWATREAQERVDN